MAGLAPAIHVFKHHKKTWITGTSPVMTAVDVEAKVAKAHTDRPETKLPGLSNVEHSPLAPRYGYVAASSRF